MEWFTGDTTQAIAKCKAENLVLVVYIAADNEDTQALNEVWNTSEVREVFAQNCICLNLQSSSLPGQQFSQIYPVLVLPSIFFLSSNGVPLEVIVGKCTADELKRKATNILATVQPVPSASTYDSGEASLTVQPEVEQAASQDTITAQTETQTQTAQASGGVDVAQSEDSREEKVRKARELIQQKQREKSEAAKQKAKEEELKRRELGRDVDKLKQFQKEQESREISDQMKKDKEEVRLAREKVRQQIAEDREARATKFNKEKGEQAEEQRKKAQEKLRKAAEEAERIAIANSSKARIQFRLPDGSSMNTEFDADEELSKARRFVIESEKNPFGTNFRLSTIFPRRVFADDDYTSTFRQLSLCPTNALLVLPPVLGTIGNPGRAPGSSSSMFSYLLLVFAPFIYVWNGIMAFIFARPPSVQPAPPRQEQQTSQQPSNIQPETEASPDQPSVRRRVGRLSDLSRDADDTNTWNGNSTEQQ